MAEPLTQDAGDSSDGRPAFPVRRVVPVAILVIAGVIFALLVPMPVHGRVATAIGDLAHAPLFGSLALAWLWTWGRLRPLDRHNVADGQPPQERPVHQGRRLVFRGVCVWIVLSTFGVCMEVVQSGVGRSMSRHDAIANSLGIAAAIAAYVATWFWLHRRRRSAAVFFLAAAVILISAWMRPAMVLADVIAIHRRFPLLGSFESDDEMSRWYLERVDARRSRDHVTDGEWSIEVDFRPHPKNRPLITLHQMVQNWETYDTLEVDVTLAADHPNAEESIFIAVIDRGRGFVYSQTETAFRGETSRLRFPIPENGAIVEGRKIRYLDLGLERCEVPVQVHFDRVKLVQSSK